MQEFKKLPFFMSIPHSGEQVPKEVTWLQSLPEETLMRDVDRYVDVLYKPTIDKHGIETFITPWHRYVVDLNRETSDFDLAAVKGAKEPKGTHPKGLHWSVTTFNEPLIKEAMTMELHENLVSQYYTPFHSSIQGKIADLNKSFDQSFHLDLHSMPSKGTSLHPDPGQTRAEIVVSDFHGKSACEEYKEIVMKAYQEAGFQVAYNWPYVGGGITRMYGKPESGHHTIQVELNRNLYMNEDTKQLKQDSLSQMQLKLEKAIVGVMVGLKDFLNGENKVSRS